MLNLHSGDTIRKKPTMEPWLVIRIFPMGWFVVDLTSADDPAIPRLILARNFDNWVRDIDAHDEEILENTEVRYNERIQREWNFI